MGGARNEYNRVLAVAREHSAVLGLILTGSRGRNALIHSGSDWDVRLVVRDDAFANVADDLATSHGSPVEVVVFALRTFEAEGRDWILDRVGSVQLRSLPSRDRQARRRHCAARGRQRASCHP